MYYIFFYPFICLWAFRLSSYLDYCKQSCDKHRGAFFLNYSLVWIYAQEWDCQSVCWFWFFKVTPGCCPQWLHQFASPPTNNGRLLTSQHVPKPSWLPSLSTQSFGILITAGLAPGRERPSLHEGQLRSAGHWTRACSETVMASEPGAQVRMLPESWWGCGWLPCRVPGGRDSSPHNSSPSFPGRLEAGKAWEAEADRGESGTPRVGPCREVPGLTHPRLSAGADTPCAQVSNARWGMCLHQAPSIKLQQVSWKERSH